MDSNVYTNIAPDTGIAGEAIYKGGKLWEPTYETGEPTTQNRAAMERLLTRSAATAREGIVPSVGGTTEDLGAAYDRYKAAAEAGGRQPVAFMDFTRRMATIEPSVLQGQEQYTPRGFIPPSTIERPPIRPPKTGDVFLDIQRENVYKKELQDYLSKQKMGIEEQKASAEGMRGIADIEESRAKVRAFEPKERGEGQPAGPSSKDILEAQQRALDIQKEMRGTYDPNTGAYIPMPEAQRLNLERQLSTLQRAFPQLQFEVAKPSEWTKYLQ